MKTNTKIFLSIILIVISDSLLYISFSGVNNQLFTPISIICKFLSLFILISIVQKSSLIGDLPNSIRNVYKLFVWWNIITFLRGIYIAENYWDWKFLIFNSLFFSLVPLSLYVGKNVEMVRTTFYFILKYLFVWGLVLIPITLVTNEELYSRIMIPVNIFIILIPYLKPKYKYRIILVAIISLFMVMSFRTNIIKMIASVLILLLYYYRSYFGVKGMKIIRFALFLLPLVLVLVAVFGRFNLFSSIATNETYIYQNRNGDVEDLATDTRTFLYMDVFLTLEKKAAWIMGEGAGGKYESNYFSTIGTYHERYSSEVGFLNTILYSGFVGLLLYFLVLYISTYLAIYKSNNWLSKMLGVYIAFRWVTYFIEEFTQFDINFYFFWLVIGLISSKYFREMNDNELKTLLSF